VPYILCLISCVLYLVSCVLCLVSCVLCLAGVENNTRGSGGANGAGLAEGEVLELVF